MRSKLFNTHIQPACSYCSHGDLSRDKTAVLCEKRGVVDLTFSCRAFDYSPLKRVPKKPRKLQDFDRSDFEL